MASAKLSKDEMAKARNKRLRMRCQLKLAAMYYEPDHAESMRMLGLFHSELRDYVKQYSFYRLDKVWDDWDKYFGDFEHEHS